MQTGRTVPGLRSGKRRRRPGADRRDSSWNLSCAVLRQISGRQSESARNLYRSRVSIQRQNSPSGFQAGTRSQATTATSKGFPVGPRHELVETLSRSAHRWIPGIHGDQMGFRDRNNEIEARQVQASSQGIVPQDFEGLASLPRGRRDAAFSEKGETQAGDHSSSSSVLTYRVPAGMEGAKAATAGREAKCSYRVSPFVRRTRRIESIGTSSSTQGE